MSKGGVAADPVAVVATALFLQRNIMLVTSVPGSSHTKSVLWVQGKASYDKLVPDSVFLGYERLQTYIPLRPAADMVCKVYIVVENISQTRTAHNYSAWITPMFFFSSLKQSWLNCTIMQVVAYHPQVRLNLVLFRSVLLWRNFCVTFGDVVEIVKVFETITVLYPKSNLATFNWSMYFWSWHFPRWRNPEEVLHYSLTLDMILSEKRPKCKMWKEHWNKMCYKARCAFCDLKHLADIWVP